MSLHPGLKHPTSQSLRRGWLFGVTYHNMRGAIASATAAWAILLDRSAVVGNRFAVKYTGLLANFLNGFFSLEKPLSQQPLAS
jgi:hypothetical protein